MAFKIRRVPYYFASVPDEPSEACGLLTQLSELGVSMLAFSAVPVGPSRTQLCLFPEDAALLVRKAVPYRGLTREGKEGGAFQAITPTLANRSMKAIGMLATTNASQPSVEVSILSPSTSSSPSPNST